MAASGRVDRRMSPRGARVRFSVRPEEGGKAVNVSVPRGVLPRRAGERCRGHNAKAPMSLITATPSPSTRRRARQWDHVVLFDESYMFREHRARWLYTGVTRAAKRLTLVR